MNVVVTGGAGQLGTQVLRRLLASRENLRLVSLDLAPPALPLGRLAHVQADIRDPDLSRHLEGADAVVHLAFAVTSYLPRAQYDDINVNGTKNVFRAAQAAGVKHVVYTSSIAAFGLVRGHPVPLVEDSPRLPNPAFPYAAAKQAIEDFLDRFEPDHPGLTVTRLRPAVLVGTHMEHPLGGALRAGLIPDSGGSVIPVVWDEDVADAVVLALEQRAGGAFILSADDCLVPEEIARQTGLRFIRLPHHLVRTVLLAISTVQRARGKRAHDPVWLDGLRGVALQVSSEKAHRQLGWRPSCPRSLDVFRRFLDTAPRRLDPRLRVFFALAPLAGAGASPEEDRRLSASIHLALTGPTGGDLGVIFEAGHLRITPRPPRPPQAIVRLAAQALRALLAGDADLAALERTGQVQIEGDPAGALALCALVATLRARRGAQGFVARRLSAWLREAV